MSKTATTLAIAASCATLVQAATHTSGAIIVEYYDSTKAKCLERDEVDLESMTGSQLGVCAPDGDSESYKYDSCTDDGDGKITSTWSEYKTTDCTGASVKETETYSVDEMCGYKAHYICTSDTKFYNTYELFVSHTERFINPTTTTSCDGDFYEFKAHEKKNDLLVCNPTECATVESENYSWKRACKDSEEDAYCFHIDSKIDYKGVEYTYEDLKAGKEPECTVPHSPSSKGVVITTSCDKTVRVTDTHLMATTKGFQLAYSLKAGDVMYGDYDKQTCIVKSVEKEKTTQQYFGLNCVHSEVLASGLRASTFGDFHTLPSWYMTYVGGLVGSEAASSLGEYIADWYFLKK